VTTIRQDALREAAEIFRRDVVPLLKAQRGFVGTTMVVDPASGSAQFLTCWRTLSDLADLNENLFFEAQVGKLAKYFTTRPQVDIVDVSIFEEYHASVANDGSAKSSIEGGD